MLFNVPGMHLHESLHSLLWPGTPFPPCWARCSLTFFRPLAQGHLLRHNPVFQVLGFFALLPLATCLDALHFLVFARSRSSFWSQAFLLPHRQSGGGQGVSPIGQDGAGGDSYTKRPKAKKMMDRGEKTTTQNLMGLNRKGEWALRQENTILPGHRAHD